MMGSMVQCILCVSILAACGQNYFVTSTPLRVATTDGPNGGDGGDYFNDYTDASYLHTDIIGVRSINISYSDQVESIQVTYLLANKSLYKAPRRGSVKHINPPVEIKLVSGEYIQKIEGKTNGVLVDQFSIVTYKPEERSVTTYGPFGSGGEKYFSYVGYVVGFYGRSGDMLDSLGVYHLPPANKSRVYGYAEEPPNFDQNPDTGYYPPVVKIKKLIITHGIMVNSIQAQYQLRGGATRLGAKIGGDGSKSSTIEFADQEAVIVVRGTSTKHELCELTLISLRRPTDNAVWYHGPYGGPCLTEKGENFTFDTGNVLGFFGSASSSRVAGLGVYYI